MIEGYEAALVLEERGDHLRLHNTALSELLPGVSWKARISGGAIKVRIIFS